MAGQLDITENARLSVAPMMDWTDRHCRFFHRQISKCTLLYTEMITAPALVRGGATHLLDYSAEEHPVAVQLGGSDPAELAQATQMCTDHGYDEINLNVGCPSDRVQSGAFGAVLMKSPDLVAECVQAMARATARPVTVKCRIGVDDQLPEQVLPDFIARMADAGVTRMAIHARMAWLDGLSPKDNREIPPLNYPLVHEMKAKFPQLHLSINGGLTGLHEAQTHLAAGMDGAMLGRAAYHTPWHVLADADRAIFGLKAPAQTRFDVARAMIPYIEAHLARGGRMGQVTRHMLGLFTGQPGARRYRQILSGEVHKPGAGPHVLETALAAVEEQAA